MTDAITAPRRTPRTVAFVLPSLAGGGAERVMLELAAGLDRAAWAPTLVLLHASGPLATRLPDALPVVDLARPRLRAALPGLVRTLRRLRPAITVSSLGYVNLALAGMRRLLPGRLVLREANLPSLSLPATGWPLLFRTGYRRLYPAADRVIATSDRMRQELAGFGVPAGRLVVLPNPVPEARLRAEAEPIRRAAWEPPSGDPASGDPASEDPASEGPRFVAAGRLHRQKGFDRLIDWLAEADAVRGTAAGSLHIFGDGADHAALAGRIAARGLAGRVVLAGFDTRLAAWLAGADAVLLPSRWEGMPNTALDALACGTPVIATPDSGGIAEVAAAAPPGAVTIATAGPAFIAALAAVPARPAGGLRPSLLPPTYAAPAVTARFEALLHAVADHAN